jgi:hypothetical protein
MSLTMLAGSTQNLLENRNITNVECQLLRRLEKAEKKVIIKELWSFEEQSPHFPHRYRWIG